VLEDGTYFVLESRWEIVACGGVESPREALQRARPTRRAATACFDPASEAAHVRAMFVRARLDASRPGTRILDACEAAARNAGFRRLSLGATLPGYPLYARFGFCRGRPGGRSRLPDGDRHRVVTDGEADRRATLTGGRRFA
jgi:hypothetical protein